MTSAQGPGGNPPRDADEDTQALAVVPGSAARAAGPGAPSGGPGRPTPNRSEGSRPEPDRAGRDRPAPGRPGTDRPGSGQERASGPLSEPTTVLPAAAAMAAAGAGAGSAVRRPGPPRPTGSRPAAGRSTAQRPARPGDSSRPAARSRRARLALQRIDPWSVFLFTLVASLFLGVALVVAVAALYSVLSSLGVLTSINDLYVEVIGGDDTTPLFTAQRFLGGAAVLAAVNVVLLTLLATLSALLYNLCTSFTGGIEVTLGERDG